MTVSAAVFRKSNWPVLWNSRFNYATALASEMREIVGSFAARSSVAAKDQAGDVIGLSRGSHEIVHLFHQKL